MSLLVVYILSLTVDCRISRMRVPRDLASVPNGFEIKSTMFDPRLPPRRGHGFLSVCVLQHR
jgi:hypothetical protein